MAEALVYLLIVGLLTSAMWTAAAGLAGLMRRMQ
jgi:hypothetical protein